MLDSSPTLLRGKPVDGELGKNPIRQLHSDEVILMNAGFHTSIPDSEASDLIFAPVSFDNQQIAFLKAGLCKLPLGQPDGLYLIEPEFILIDVSNPEVGNLQFVAVTLAVFRESTRDNSCVREPDKSPTLCRPFRARVRGVAGTQGVALGWYVSPLWGSRACCGRRACGGGKV
jgi:hypothetical protein